jgi:heme/copper-type cytochrome/quinol oxidase subunit 3
VTWVYHGIIEKGQEQALTIALGLVFTGLQGMEYYQALALHSTFFLSQQHGGHVDKPG